MDDLIIVAPNIEEGIKRLKRVLQVASDYGLDINKSKCQLLQFRIEYLGHVVENGKIYPSPDKVRAVLNFPQPHTLKDVQSFLGLSGYFQKVHRMLCGKGKAFKRHVKKGKVVSIWPQRKRVMGAVKIGFEL